MTAAASGTQPAVGGSLPSRLAAHGISQAFRVGGQELLVLQDVSLSAADGELIAILGPSGAGKSTLFNILAGLQMPQRGWVEIDGRDATGQLGQVAYMPQKDLLLPWRSVLDNTILGLQLAGMRRREARERARAYFPRFGLAGFEQVYPSALSGGMRQRTALLRTFLAGQRVPSGCLLLDEPFGALDAITRASMQQWLLEVRALFGQTILLVTHDVDEAIFLADRIYVLSARPGRVALTVEVPIARPRIYAETVTSPAFTDLKRRLLEVLAPAIEDGAPSARGPSRGLVAGAGPGTSRVSGLPASIADQSDRARREGGRPRAAAPTESGRGFRDGERQ